MTRLRRERGVALIAMMALLVMGASWYMVSAVNRGNRTALARAHNAEVLRLAKQALLGWAAQQALHSDEENPGRLPCPEAAGYIGTENQGVASGNCGSGTVVGRLPWRTIGLNKLSDDAGEPLWYAVSDGWKLNTSTAILGINSNSSGAMTLDAQTVVAVIIAPGAAIDIAPNSVQIAAGCAARSQRRTVSTPDYRDYLECSNATNPIDASFVTDVTDNAANPVLNDQIVSITAAEVLAVVEASVAARIERDVMPELQGAYDSSAYGGSSTAPIFPFAVPFGDPSTSSFKGVAGTTQGLLPLTRAQNCDPDTDARCDTSFVQWNTGAGITISKVSGSSSLVSYTCTSSTGAQISCAITYRRTCGEWTFCLNGIRVQINATASSVGMTLKTLTTSGTTGGASPSLSAPLQADGSASAAYRGTLSGSWNWCTNNGCSTTVTDTETITIPITVFADHRLTRVQSGDAWYWFMANKWYEVTYYAIAPSHAPSGSPHECSDAATADCLALTGHVPAANVRGVLSLAGRPMTGVSRPSANLADYLDTTENRNGDRTFERNRASATFNDRFVSLGSY